MSSRALATDNFSALSWSMIGIDLLTHPAVPSALREFWRNSESHSFYKKSASISVVLGVLGIMEGEFHNIRRF
jgi:hypothetical protein